MYSYKKKGYKKKSYRKREISWADVAKKALSTANYVRGLINVEKKWFDGQNSGYPSAINIDNAGTVVHVSNITQGDGASNRDGNSVRCKSVYLTGRSALGSGATASQQVRMMLVRDNDNQGALPTVANVLASAFISSPLNLNNPGRFTVLYDKVFTLQLSSAGASTVTFDKYIKYNEHIKYGGSAGTIADAREGNLFILAISDVAAGATAPFLLFNTRLRYIDN